MGEGREVSIFRHPSGKGKEEEREVGWTGDGGEVLKSLMLARSLASLFSRPRAPKSGERDFLAPIRIERCRSILLPIFWSERASQGPD